MPSASTTRNRRVVVVGSFRRGVTDYTTVQLMPDDRHLLVVVNGAGYMVELVSNALIAEVGRNIFSVISEDSPPLPLVDRGGTTLAAFGPEGSDAEHGMVSAADHP